MHLTCFDMDIVEVVDEMAVVAAQKIALIAVVGVLERACIPVV